MVEKRVLENSEKKELLKELNIHEKIEKESSLSWDGNNLMMRLPKEIANYLNLDEKNRFENNIKFTIEETDKGVIKTFEVVKRTKPKWVRKKK